MPFTILYPDAKALDLDLEREATGGDVSLINARQNRFEEIDKSTWATTDAVVVVRMPIDARVIESLERCRIVVRSGVGYDVVDLETCGAAGIPVCNVPDYGTTEVADTAIAMMLSFARGTATYDAALRADAEGSWTHTHNVTARRLRGARFGVIGLGRIGTAAALRARGFGMDIAFYDPYRPNGTELGLGFTRYRSLSDLLENSDVISMHTPLTKETRGMIDSAAVAAIKPGAYVINTSRGPVCDTSALLAGLKSGRLAAVGLDVLPEEPVMPGTALPPDPLVSAWRANEPWIKGRVLLSPHSGFFSPDAYVDQRRKAVETAYFYLRDGTLANCVNTEFLKGRR
jgi:phosphoglycerate dehydrogenase-like enzyme